MNSADTTPDTTTANGATVTTVALAAWLRRADALLTEHAGELNDLDSAIGDGDHGTNMRRGFTAVAGVLPDLEGGTPDALLKKVGATLVSTVGGASGPLYGTFFLRMGTSSAGAETLDAHSLLAALQAGVDGIGQRGKAILGQKTMLDAWLPALDAYGRATDDLDAALQAGSKAAAQGRDDSAALEARKGRASYLGERSIGHVDPGAASTALLWEAAAETLGHDAPAGADASRDAGTGLTEDEDAVS